MLSACRCPGTTRSSASSTSRPSSDAAVHDARRRPAPGDRRPPRRDRREGPPADRGRGAASSSSAQIDEARSELIALVTHELRTPLAVVRAYTELLADDPPLEGRESRDPTGAPSAQAWHDAAMEQVERLDRLVDSILASVRRRPRRGRGGRSRPTSRRRSREVAASIEPIVRQHRLERRGRGSASTRWPIRRGSARSSSTSIENAVKYAPPDTTITIDCDPRRGLRPDRRDRRGPGRPGGVARADLRALCAARHAHGARLRDRAVCREAAGRVDGRPAVVRAGRCRAAPDSSSPCPLRPAV